MSTSNVVNANCVLRRNLRRQPYGRCSVCTLELRGCHAWQASLLSFGMIILALAAFRKIRRGSRLARRRDREQGPGEDF